MRLLFFLGHPAHFHLFKHIIKILEENGHEAAILIKSKDILEDLCKVSGLKFINILPRVRGNSKIAMAYSILKKDYYIAKFVRKFKPKLLIGSEASLSHVGRLLNIPSFEFSEDDAEEIKLYALISYPFFTNIVTPGVCSAWKWEKKKIGYEGYHELAYLHPNHFNPDPSVLSEIRLSRNEKFFIMRFNVFKAHHDFGETGLSFEQKINLVRLLEKYGKVLINTEGTIEIELIKYRLKISPEKMHSLLYYATMFVGDSNTMTSEAAVLGTPAIKCNTFVGRSSVPIEIEEKYKLCFGFFPSQENKMINKIKELLALPDLKEECQKRRVRMLKDKIDVTAFMVWFIENYPESVKIMKENPEYQQRFK